jgi:hypothetical protein
VFGLKLGDQKKEALETRKKKALVSTKKPRNKKGSPGDQKKRKLWCLKRSQGVWKGGPETKAVEYGANRQTLYPSERKGD